MTRRVPVLIVGGGPVGLALAVELGWRGIVCELVEQGDGALSTPKMNEVNARSMEFCRRWGIADKVLDCPFPADYPLDVAFVTSLSGYELSRLPRAPRNSQEPMPEAPHRMQACSQIWFDPMLRERAQTFASVRLHHRCRLDSFEQSQDSVTAQLTDIATGAHEAVVADYLVGCDGAASMVRRGLGIELVGQGTIGHPINLFFRAPADLIARCGKRPATFFLAIDETGLWGNLRIIDPRNGLWRLMVDSTDGSATVQTVDRDFYLRRALGCDVPVDWVEVNIWRRRSALADAYSRGRVFLAGDAVHQLSPTGGMGMNTGLGDAVDIGWKLAAMLEGWGGARLLKSYDAERRPVGARAVRMATWFYKNSENFPKGSPLLTEDSETGARHRSEIGERLLQAIGPEFRTVGLQLGYRYEGSSICMPDGTPEPPDDPAEYTPSARPGSRAPHAWLSDGRSTLDLFGRGFTLLRFPGAPPGDAIERAARKCGVPLTALALDEPEAALLYERKLVLVRPDGHVAWRGNESPRDAAALIDRVRGALSP